MKKRKQLKKCSAVLLAISLILSMAVPRIASAEETSAKPSVEQTDDTQTAQKEGDKGDSVQTVADNQYDTTKPVIEKVKFPQNGQTLKVGDTLKFYVYAYDADSGINSIYAYLNYQKGGQYVSGNSLTCTYDETEKRYELTCTLSERNVDSAAITTIKAVDKNSNYVNWECWDSSAGTHKYAVKIEPTEFPTVSVRNFTPASNQQTVEAGTQLAYSFELEGDTLPTDESGITVEFRNETNHHTFGTTADFDSADGKYKGLVYADYPAGKWELDAIYQNVDGATWNFQMENMKDFWFEVPESQSSIPQITSIALEKNGEVLKKGEKVTLSVKVESKETMGDYGSAYFRPSADIDTWSQFVSLEYDAKSSTYTGVFEVTEDTYPCEWFLSDIDVRNNSNMKADASKKYPDLTTDYPFYVNVTDGTTFVTPTYNVNVRFHAFGKDGTWNTVKEFSKADVERRTTWKETGLTVSEMQDGYQGLKQIGWVDQNGQDFDENTPIISNSYINLYAKYEKTPVIFSYEYVNENGGWEYDSNHIILFPNGSTYKDVKEYLAKQPAPETTYKDLQFDHWTITNIADANKPLAGNIYLSVQAVYNKNIVNASYGYLNHEGIWNHAQDTLLFDKGTTYQQAIEQAEQYQIKDGLSGVQFESWETTGYLPDLDTPLGEAGGVSLRFNASYTGKVVINPTKLYYDTKGQQLWSIEKALVLEKGTTYETAYQTLRNQELPSMYKGLRFSGWNISEKSGVISTNYEEVYLNAEYENYMVRYVLDDMFKNPGSYGGGEPDFEYIYCQLAEKGETVTIPSSFDGYKNITWVQKPTEETTFKVEHDMHFYGYGDKDGSEPDKPTDPEEPDKPTNPEEPDKPTNPDKPVVPEQPTNPQLPQDVIDNVVNDLNNASGGESITISMDGATVVPKDVLEAAQGKDVEIKLDMGGYTWTINGKDILAEDLKDINLEVKQNSNAIPNKVIQSLAGDNPTQQLSLTHNGDFGFKASLTINVGSQYHGQYGNLLYYDSDGKVVFINAGMIDENGNVTLTFSHASDYVIVMNKQKMSDNDVPKDLRQNTKQNAVATGDSSHTSIPAFTAIFALLAFTIVSKRKKEVK